jgi:hypothetical protein
MIKIVGAKLTDGRVIDLDIDNQVIVKIENSTNNLSKGAVDGSTKLFTRFGRYAYPLKRAWP